MEKEVARKLPKRYFFENGPNKTNNYQANAENYDGLLHSLSFLEDWINKTFLFLSQNLRCLETPKQEFDSLFLEGDCFAQPEPTILLLPLSTCSLTKLGKNDELCYTLLGLLPKSIPCMVVNLLLLIKKEESQKK